MYIALQKCRFDNNTGDFVLKVHQLDIIYFDNNELAFKNGDVS